MFFQLPRRVFHWLVFIALLAITIGWLARGHDVRQRISRRVSSSARAKVENIVRDLEAENPKAAAELTTLRENHQIRLAVDAALLESDYRGGLSEVQRLADQQAGSDRLAYQIQLARLASDANLLPTQQERNEFLWAHATSLELLATDPAAQDDYLAYLDNAAAINGADWRLAKGNSMGMLVASFLRDAGAADDVRHYYEQEQDWLDELLMDVIAVADSSQTDGGKDLIPTIVQLAYDYRPHFRKAVRDDQLGAVAFFLFDEYGDIIVRTVARGVPLEEVLDVVFANSDFLNEHWQAKHPAEAAERLILVRNQKPSVWKAARLSAMALRLNDDVPNLADELLEKYGTDDVVALLYAGYEDEIVFAADCVVTFGDLAIWVLSHYSESETFRDALIAPGVGPRIIPYVARFSDGGLDRWEQNRKWLDRYFELDGTPIDPEWWTYIPGGAAANVARNWARKDPNEWGELGWAALDVADAALLVASFGTSAAVTTSARSGATQVGRKVVKRQAVQAGRQAARRAPAGSRALTRAKATSLLRRTAQSRIGWVAQSKRVWRAVGQAVVQPARKLAQVTLEAGRKLHGAWRAVPPRTRRIVYRSLLAVGLFVTITQRTLPAMEAIGEAAGKFVGRVIKDTGSALAAGLGAALRELLGELGDGTAPWIGWGVYIGVCLLFVAALWRSLPVRSGRLRHV